jgi:oligopeptide/dipeptide ABC transporter ATP-binding protein
VAEEGSAIDVLTAPVHPYTRGLLASVPDFRSDNATGTKEIPGIPPNQAQLMPGCRFADRCELVQPKCRSHRSPLVKVGAGPVPHRVACPVVIAAEGIVTHD